MSAPVVVYISGAGGLWKNEIPHYQKTPRPSWAVVFNVQGNSKVRTPDYMCSVLAWLRRSITQQRQNKIILVGFSRGAAWIIDLMQTQAANIDAAVAFAGYPWISDAWEDEHEARNLLQVRRPLLLVRRTCLLKTTR